MVKWSVRLHESFKNSHVPTEDAQISSNGQLEFVKVSGTVTYSLRMHRHCQMVSSTLWKCPERSRTCWRWADTSNDELDFMNVSRTAWVTYILSISKHGQMVSSTPQKCPKRSRTIYGCASMVKWSARFHEIVRNGHIHTKYEQTWANGQLDFMKVSGTVTYDLRMGRHGQMVSLTSGKCLEQSRTSWIWANISKWSVQLHKGGPNSNLLAEYEQTWLNGQLDFMKVSRTVAYRLRMCRHGQIMSSTSWICPERSHTN